MGWGAEEKRSVLRVYSADKSHAWSCVARNCRQPEGSQGQRRDPTRIRKLAVAFAIWERQGGREAEWQRGLGSVPLTKAAVSTEDQGGCQERLAAEVREPVVCRHLGQRRAVHL